MTKMLPSLKAMAEDKSAEFDGISKNTGFNVDPYKIQIEPGFNRPISREMVESIKTGWRNGAMIPEIVLRVEDGQVWMVDGEHRLIAAKELNEDPEYVAKEGRIESMRAFHFRGDEEARQIHLFTSAKKNEMSMLDQGIKMLWLINRGRNNAYIANKIGCSANHVADCLRLAEARDDVKDQVRSGAVSDSVASQVVKQHGSQSGKVIEKAKAEAAKDGKTKVSAKHIPGLKAKTLEQAIKEEMDSGGKVLAETACPKHANLIAYLRGTAAMKDAA